MPFDQFVSANIRYGHWKTGDGPLGGTGTQQKADYHPHSLKDARNTLPASRINFMKESHFTVD